jgi:hypothetical protein
MPSLLAAAPSPFITRPLLAIALHCHHYSLRDLSLPSPFPSLPVRLSTLQCHCDSSPRHACAVCSLLSPSRTKLDISLPLQCCVMAYQICAAASRRSASTWPRITHPHSSLPSPHNTPPFRRHGGVAMTLLLRIKLNSAPAVPTTLFCAKALPFYALPHPCVTLRYYSVPVLHCSSRFPSYA